MTKEELALEVIERLKKEYPLAQCTLDYDQAWKLLVSVRLAAQCTDARVNIVVEDLYAKYPETAMEPEGLSACGQQLLESGNLVYTDNISEVLEFDNPAPIYYDFIDLYLSDVDTPDEEFADLPWFVDEDGVTGIIPGKVYTFGYSESSKSATASTTGGKLGASR